VYWLYSRSYCYYRVWSAISIIMSSVCLSVTLCIVALRVGVHGKKLYQRVTSNRQVSICPFRHFCCGMYRLATKRTGTNKSKKTRLWVFFETNNLTCTGRLVVLHSVTFTDFVNFGQSRFSALSLGVFISSTCWIGPCKSAVRQLVTTAGLIVRQYIVRRTQYDRLSQQQLSFLFRNTGRAL